VILGLTSDLVASNGVLAFPDYPLHALAGFEDLVIVHLDVSNGHDPAELADLDLLISVPHGAPLDRAALAQAQRLAAVIRVGVGFEDCDLPVLTSGGTALVLPTQATRRPTAVAALTLILALATRLLDKHRITLAGPGLWEERAEFRGVDVRGKILGLVGCGAIGRELIAIARPLGFSLAIYDPGLAADDAAALGAVPLALEELLARSDFVSIHCPLTPETRHLINAPRLALMKPTAFLVNTARGGVIDQAALVRALIGHAIAGAGLDVFEPEPLPADDLLLQSPNVLFSAHALNWTRELDAELGHTNIEAVASLLKGKDPGVLANPGVLKDQTFRDKLARIAALSAAARNSDILTTAKAIPGTGGPTR
jgi:phosphoglycerate dehydrogenase-like enzyme